MKRYPTVVLKIFIVFISILVLSFCIFGLVSLFKNPINQYYSNVLYPIIIGFYLSVTPIVLILYKGFIVLKYIEKNNIFTQDSVNVLKFMKYCSYIISLIYAIMLPFIYLLAEKDDSPGLVIIGIIPVITSIIFGISFTIFQGILLDGIKLKLEK